MDSLALDAALTRLGRDYPAVDGVVVIRHGYAVAERYYHGHGPKDRVDLFSATKSVTSILIGIALDRHLFRDVEQSIADFIPEYFARADADSAKRRISVRNLLTMTSGLDWDESHAADYFRDAPGQAVGILRRKLVAEPGTRFNYSSGNAHLLAIALSHASKTTPRDFGNDNLFVPLGFTVRFLDWPADENGVNSGGSALELSPREMAKLGYLYLNAGCWDGRQIVSAEWVAQSIRKWSESGPPPNGNGYGYLWWLSSVIERAYMAIGYAGQYILVAPSQDMVVAAVAHPTPEGSRHFEVLRDVVLSAAGETRPRSARSGQPSAPGAATDNRPP